MANDQPLDEFWNSVPPCECPWDGHSDPAQSRRRVVSPCARAVVRSRSRMAVNMDGTCVMPVLTSSLYFWENSIRKNNFVLHFNVFKCILDYSNKEILDC